MNLVRLLAEGRFGQVLRLVARGGYSPCAQALEVYRACADWIAGTDCDEETARLIAARAVQFEEWILGETGR